MGAACTCEVRRASIGPGLWRDPPSGLPDAGRSFGFVPSLMRQITAFTGEVRHDSGGLVPGHVSWHLAKIAGSEPLPPPELIVTPSYRWRSPQVHLAGASEHAAQITDSVPSRQLELGHAAICSW